MIDTFGQHIDREFRKLREIDLDGAQRRRRVRPGGHAVETDHLHVLRHAQSAVREPAYHAERREIVGAARAVELGATMSAPCGENTFRNRMPGDDAIGHIPGFEHHRLVIGQSGVGQRSACAAQSQSERVLGMRQIGAGGEPVADDRDIAASAVDEMLHRRAFGLLVGEVHGIDGRRLLAGVQQHEWSAAIEFGQRHICAQACGVQDLAIEQLPGERIAAQRVLGSVRRILRLLDEWNKSAGHDFVAQRLREL